MGQEHDGWVFQGGTGPGTGYGPMPDGRAYRILSRLALIGLACWCAYILAWLAWSGAHVRNDALTELIMASGAPAPCACAAVVDAYLVGADIWLLLGTCAAKALSFLGRKLSGVPRHDAEYGRRSEAACMCVFALHALAFLAVLASSIFVTAAAFGMGLEHDSQGYWILGAVIVGPLMLFGGFGACIASGTAAATSWPLSALAIKWVKEIWHGCRYGTPGKEKAPWES